METVPRNIYCKFLLGHEGEVQNILGEETYQRTRPPITFSDKRTSGVLSLGFTHVQKTGQRQPRRVENVPDEGGPKPVFGRGVLRDVFLPLLFSPTHGVL